MALFLTLIFAIMCFFLIDSWGYSIYKILNKSTKISLSVTFSIGLISFIIFECIKFILIVICYKIQILYEYIWEITNLLTVIISIISIYISYFRFKRYRMFKWNNIIDLLVPMFLVFSSVIYINIIYNNTQYNYVNIAYQINVKSKIYFTNINYIFSIKNRIMTFIYTDIINFTKIGNLYYAKLVTIYVTSYIFSSFIWLLIKDIIFKKLNTKNSKMFYSIIFFLLLMSMEIVFTIKIFNPIWTLIITILLYLWIDEMNKYKIQLILTIILIFYINNDSIQFIISSILFVIIKKIINVKNRNIKINRNILLSIYIIIYILLEMYMIIYIKDILWINHLEMLLLSLFIYFINQSIDIKNELLIYVIIILKVLVTKEYIELGQWNKILNLLTLLVRYYYLYLLIEYFLKFKYSLEIFKYLLIISFVSPYEFGNLSVSTNYITLNSHFQEFESNSTFSNREVMKYLYKHKLNNNSTFVVNNDHSRYIHQKNYNNEVLKAKDETFEPIVTFLPKILLHKNSEVKYKNIFIDIFQYNSLQKKEVKIIKKRWLKKEEIKLYQGIGEKIFIHLKRVK